MADRIAELEAELAALRAGDASDERDDGAAAPARATERMTKPKLVTMAVQAGLPLPDAQGRTKAELVAAITALDAARPVGATQPKAAARNAAQPDEFGSWDEFWSAHKRRERAKRGKAPTTVIRGVEVTIPHDMPMGFDKRAEELEGSDDESDVAELIAELFGANVYAQWVANGMEGEEFQVVLLWGMMHGKGQRITFEQAAEAVATEGKSLQSGSNRADRRRSAQAGRSSSRTSTENTGSTRKRSRG